MENVRVGCRLETNQSMKPRVHVVGLLSFLVFSCGCASTRGSGQLPPQAIPPLHGSYHEVRPGDTLWRIAQCYGLEVDALAKANRLPSASQLNVGQHLFIPLPNDSDHFFWPILGSIGPSSHGLEIAGAPGSLVRAARRGRVAVATRQLSGWGKTVILDHSDGYLTVYAGLDQLFVTPGSEVRQGAAVGSLGNRPLHFEIRFGSSSKNTITLLPSHEPS